MEKNEKISLPQITFRKSELIEELENMKFRSAWKNGIRACAVDLLEDLENDTFSGSLADLKSELLNGADSWPGNPWKHYAWNGCGMIYNYDIAKRFCNPSELRKTENGAKRPNAREDWLDVYARGLFQAWNLIENTLSASL